MLSEHGRLSDSCRLTNGSGNSGVMEVPETEELKAVPGQA